MFTMEKVLNHFKNIETAQDLKKERLSLSDYRDLSLTLQSVVDVGRGTTMIQNVSDWCKKHGMKVLDESCCFVVYKI